MSRIRHSAQYNVGQRSEEQCEESSEGWESEEGFIGSSAEHDVVHDPGEVPPGGRGPDPVCIRKANPR